MTGLGGKAVERGNSETLLDFRGTDGFILARLVPLGAWVGIGQWVRTDA